MNLVSVLLIVMLIESAYDDIKVATVEASPSYPRVTLDRDVVILGHPAEFNYVLLEDGRESSFFMVQCKDWPDQYWPVRSVIKKGSVYEDRGECKSVRPPYSGFKLWRNSNGQVIRRTSAKDGGQRASETTEQGQDADEAVSLSLSTTAKR